MTQSRRYELRVMNMFRSKLTVFFSVALLTAFLSSPSIATEESTVADEAIRCSGLFYLLTAIPGNQAATQLAMMMGEVYRAHASELTGKGISNGDLLAARGETAEALRSEYNDNPDRVTDLALRCNSWRASIATTFQNAVRESTDGSLSESDTEKLMLSLRAPNETPSVPPEDRLSIGEVIRQAMDSQPSESREELLEKLRKMAEESK